MVSLTDGVVDDWQLGDLHGSTVVVQFALVVSSWRLVTPAHNFDVGTGVQAEVVSRETDREGLVTHCEVEKGSSDSDVIVVRSSIIVFVLDYLTNILPVGCRHVVGVWLTLAARKVASPLVLDVGKTVDDGTVFSGDRVRARGSREHPSW